MLAKNASDGFIFYYIYIVGSECVSIDAEILHHQKLSLTEGIMLRNLIV